MGSRWSSVGTSFVVSVARLGVGLRCRAIGARPAARLVLYDYEACPYCRTVREAMSELDLEALVKPCPKGGARFRPEVGARRLPLLVDGATTIEGSHAIIAHLHARYGSRPPPFYLTARGLAIVGSALAGAARGGRGRAARPSIAPAQPLELYSFEASPYCRLVREALCELEVPYVLRNVAKGSPSRPAFVMRSGRMQVPFLVDPNVGIEMFESAHIVRHLEARYGRGT
jgi:glutathione S-transferase